MNSNIGKSHRGFIYLLFLGIISVVLFLGFSLFNTKGEPREAVVALSIVHVAVRRLGITDKQWR